MYNYYFSKTYGCVENKEVLDILLKEVKALNKDFDINDIKGIQCYNFSYYEYLYRCCLQIL